MDEKNGYKVNQKMKKPEPRKKSRKLPDWLANLDKAKCKKCGMLHLGIDCWVGEPCNKCGIVGIHACLGHKPHKPTPYDEKRMKEALDDVFKRGKSE